jgi:ABC-type amino acid transport substrate-binding protein
VIRWLLFTEPLFVDPNVFITREEHPYITDAALLDGKTIALPSGTAIAEKIRRAVP